MSLWKHLFGKKEPGTAGETSGSAAGRLAASPATPPQPQSLDGKDRVVRVFVSSTFRDMIEDRNELMAQVWPALRKLCRGRAVEFVEVDLRWGITEEQAQRQETLRHCLAEIKRCRPYFIGLLGDRYGWVPGPEAYSPALFEEERWLERAVSQRSVTELEVLHGVLNDPDMAGRAYFYFRDPKYAESVAPNRKTDYTAENPESAEKQRRLKEMIRQKCAAKNIPLREDYADPHTLAALVRADLTAALDAEFPPAHVPDVWVRDDRDHEAFAKSRRAAFYLGRKDYFDRLDAFARDGAGGCGLTVLGESGGGKSSLLANWVSRWRQANPNDFVFQHYVGSSPISTGHLALMRRLMVAIGRWCGDDGAQPGFGSEDERIPSQAEAIVKVFPDYLDRLAARSKQTGVRAVLVLDALNQLEDRERGRSLAWLPYRLPGELRLIVSTLPGDTLNALQPRGWPALTVEPLTLEERVRLIAGYLAHFAQGLSKDRVRKIAGVAAASNPLYLKTLLDDLRATGVHDRLDVQIDEYVQAPDIPALLVKILARYEREYERDRPGLVGETLALLWAARRGLTEPELLGVLKSAGQECLPAAIWSPLRFALADGLVDRDGVLAFAHEHLRRAVQRRYVPDAEAARPLRLRLANAFTERPLDARQADELPWLLHRAEARDRLRACLLDIDRFLLVHHRDQNELLSYWIWLGQEREMGKAYLKAFDVWSHSPDREMERLSDTASQLGLCLHHASLYTEAELLMRQALALNEQTFGKDHARTATCLYNLSHLFVATNRLGDAEPVVLRTLTIHEKNFGRNHLQVATDLNILAMLFFKQCRFGEAEPLMRRVVAIYERRFGANHVGVASAINNLAGLLEKLGRLRQAEPLMRRALSINEYNFGPEHPEVAISLNNLAGLLHGTNRSEKAEPLIRRALAIREKSFGPDHPMVAASLAWLAQVFFAKDRLSETESLMRRVVAILENPGGDPLPDYATALNNLGGLLCTVGRVVEAEPIMRRALAIIETRFGPEHPEVATCLNNLGGVLLATNRLREAESLMRRALAIDEASFGAEHFNVARHLDNLAHVLQVSSRHAEAESLRRRQLTILFKLHRATGHHEVNVQAAINNYIDLLTQLGHTEYEMQAKLEAVGRPLGIRFGS